MSAILFKAKALTSAFQGSRPFIISANRVSLRFKLVVSGAPATVNWYMEFGSGDANNEWFRETAEEDAGRGLVAQPSVLRTFADAGGTTLAVGTHLLSVQFRRDEQLARLQMQVTAGACIATVTAPFGRTS